MNYWFGPKLFLKLINQITGLFILFLLTFYFGFFNNLNEIGNDSIQSINIFVLSFDLFYFIKHQWFDSIDDLNLDINFKNISNLIPNPWAKAAPDINISSQSSPQKADSIKSNTPLRPSKPVDSLQLPSEAKIQSSCLAKKKFK